MQYDVNTPSEYLNQLEHDWRKEKLLEVRELLLETNPDLKESIQYKMLNFSDESGSIFHLNAQKNYVGLYLGNIKKVDPEEKFLASFDCGKGCIRIKKSNAVRESSLPVFIEHAVRLHKNGVDISC